MIKDQVGMKGSAGGGAKKSTCKVCAGAGAYAQGEGDTVKITRKRKSDAKTAQGI